VGPRAGLDGWKNLVPTGIRSRTLQPIVSCYTDCATRPTTIREARHIFHVSWLRVNGVEVTLSMLSVYAIGTNEPQQANKRFC